jgi:UDP-N-acetylmuramate dehydrogenase
LTEHINALRELCEDTLFDEPMSKHTSFRIGGAADVFMRPTCAIELQSSIDYCHANNIPLTMLGDGTNVLVRDCGIRGVVISTSQFAGVSAPGDTIQAFAGAKLAAVANVAAKAGLTGLEFASGIPGTVGGAVYMNAGAYDGMVGDFIESVAVHVPGESELRRYTREECNFGYRTSIFSNPTCGKSTQVGFIIGAHFSLTRGNEADIRAKMADLNAKRRASQPLDVPSAGSTFKRPTGHFAGKLIDDAGLRGYSVGAAQVSPKHCGFVVNNGGATAADVLALMEHVQRTVQDKFGVWLEPEVRIL